MIDAVYGQQTFFRGGHDFAPMIQKERPQYLKERK